MATNELIPVSKKGKVIKPKTGGGGRSKARVQNMSDFIPDTNHKRLDEMDGQTIYIVKLEVMSSDNFGEGYKIYFKDLPNARETYTASTFSQVVVPILDNLYKLTHDGKQISLDSPVKTTVIKVGRAVTLT